MILVYVDVHYATTRHVTNIRNNTKKSLHLPAMFFKKPHIFQALAAFIIAAGILSCSPVDLDFTTGGISQLEKHPPRVPSTEYRNVFVIYSAGFNNLSGDLEEDINDLLSSRISTNPRDAIIVFSHRTTGPRNYKVKTSPTLTHIGTDIDGSFIKDTLLVMDVETPSASAETMKEILTFVAEKFPSDRYGMLFSSHGTGWLPSNHKFTASSSWKAAANDIDHNPHDGLRPDGLPEVKSIGREEINGMQGLEIDIRDFADAIPMYLDYMIFDACLMGSIEVAYQLKDKCRQIVCSPAEILAEGMDYKSMTDYVFKHESDLAGFAENYYNFYNDPERQSAYRSGTISVVNCTALDSLAQVCKEIFARNRNKLNNLESNSSLVQKYFTMSEHQCYYDFEDIIRKSGASEEDIATFNDALKKCITYRAATDYILGTVKVSNYSGLSMYLQKSSHTALKDYYRTLEWNKATGLVQ